MLSPLRGNLQPLGVAAGINPLLVLDTFTDSDMALTSHTPDSGGTWTTTGTSLNVISNKAGNATVSAWNLIESNGADVTITVDFTWAAAGVGSSELWFRAVDGTNRWRMWYYATSNPFRLYENATQRATNATTLTNGATYQWKVVCAGDVITCYLDSTQLFTYTSSTNNTATKHGLYVEVGSARRWDNFQVLRG